MSHDDFVSDSHCIGTGNVQLRRFGSSFLSNASTEQSHRDSDDNALLAVYIVRSKNTEVEKNANFYLQLMLTHGFKTFEGRLFPSEAKFNTIRESESNDTSTIVPVTVESSPMATEIKMLKNISTYILNNPPDVTVSYLLISNKRSQKDIVDSHETVQMTVREKLGSGQFVKIWKGVLRQKSNEANSFSTASFKENLNTTITDEMHLTLRNNNSLEFSTQLAQSLQKAQSQIAKLKSEKEQVIFELNKWKDTARKLENAWDKEKTELFKNFLTLYNRVKVELRNTRNQLEHHNSKQQKSPDRSRSSSKVKSSPAKDGDIIDHVEEHDVLYFDPNEVDRLAAASNPTQTITTTEEAPVILSQEGNDAIEWSQTSLVRKNRYTGVTEIFLDTCESLTNATCQSKKRKTQIDSKFEELETCFDMKVINSFEIKSTTLHDEISKKKTKQRHDWKQEENDCSSFEGSECCSEPLL